LFNFSLGLKTISLAFSTLLCHHVGALKKDSTFFHFNLES
jgi:hypothetical protein